MSETIASITYQAYDERGNFMGERYTETFDATQTRSILDTLPVSSIEYFIEDGTANEEGDGFYYSAEAMALAENLHGDSFSVYIHLSDDEYRDYLADRAERGIPEDGVEIDTAGYEVRATIDKIQALIDSLPKDDTVLWLSTDLSWGGAADLSIVLRDDLTSDQRSAYDMDI